MIPREWPKIILLCALLASVPNNGTAQTLKEIVFQELMEDFPNPERGFYRARELPKPENFDLRGENITIIYKRISHSPQ